MKSLAEKKEAFARWFRKRWSWIYGIVLLLLVVIVIYQQITIGILKWRLDYNSDYDNEGSYTRSLYDIKIKQDAIDSDLYHLKQKVQTLEDENLYLKMKVNELDWLLKKSQW